eukprot:CAMPEP_0198227782 /NCGR_PEP_ID=MMETSP1445-20131203/110619_1 /TAXON_ID=36898 /ORGANISM="Pyramimonas sp., Strain CCMP2087" /LENGTH=238 /DNA_ID=CAMNT_0043907951 /DNA_START=386 /DNA_END=1099 /DNA_ORIENTATION=+
MWTSTTSPPRCVGPLLFAVALVLFVARSADAAVVTNTYNSNVCNCCVQNSECETAKLYCSSGYVTTSSSECCRRTPCPSSPTSTPSSPTSTPSSSANTITYTDVQTIPAATVYSKEFSNVCKITFDIKSNEPLHVMVMTKLNFGVFAANDYEGAFVFLEGSQCEDGSLQCSRSVTLSKAETYVWAVFNRDFGTFFTAGDVATVNFNFNLGSCSTRTNSVLYPSMSGSSTVGVTGVALL